MNEVCFALLELCFRTWLYIDFNDIETNDPYGPNGYFDLVLLGMHVESMEH
jgi:hypothetical protein